MGDGLSDYVNEKDLGHDKLLLSLISGISSVQCREHYQLLLLILLASL